MHIVRCALAAGSWSVYRESKSTRAEFEQLFAFAKLHQLPLRVVDSADSSLLLELGPLDDRPEVFFLKEFGVWCRLKDGEMRSRGQYVEEPNPKPEP